MKRTMLTIFVFWVLLLSPGLCLAGMLEHICGDCPGSITCEHEDDCVNDPCVEELLRPDSPKLFFAKTHGSVLVQSSLTPESGIVDARPVRNASLLPIRANLPLPVSDLPLLS